MPMRLRQEVQALPRGAGSRVALGGQIRSAIHHPSKRATAFLRSVQFFDPTTMTPPSPDHRVRHSPLAIKFVGFGKFAPSGLIDGSGLDRWRYLWLSRCWLDVPPAAFALKSIVVPVIRGIAKIRPVGPLPEPSSSSFLPTSWSSGFRLSCRFAWS